VKKRDAKTLHSNNPDLKNFCRKIPFEELSNKYVILAESEETVQYILSERVVISIALLIA
jgi:hypothetical protein